MDVAIWRQARPVNGEYPLLFSAPGLVAWSGAVPPPGITWEGAISKSGTGSISPSSRPTWSVSRCARWGLCPWLLPCCPDRPAAPAGQFLLICRPLSHQALAASISSAWPHHHRHSGPRQHRSNPDAQHCQGFGNLHFSGYNVDPVTGINYQIQIAPLVNQPHVWLVTISRLDRALEESTSLPAAIDAGIGQHNNYLTYLLNAVATNVPVGDAVILAGHSLGGLNAQLAAIAQH